MTRPLEGHQPFGPYCGCRYVGRNESQGDVEVWLLYDGVPHTEAEVPVGVLYNRIRARGTDRTDLWIARPHRPAHQGKENEFEGLDPDSAARELWRRLGSNATRPNDNCDSVCGY